MVKVIQLFLSVSIIGFYLWLLVIRKGPEYKRYKKMEREGNKTTAKWYTSKTYSRDIDSGSTEYYSKNYYEYFVAGKRYTFTQHANIDDPSITRIEIYYDKNKPKRHAQVNSEKTLLQSKRTLGCFLTVVLSAVTIPAVYILLNMIFGIDLGL
ncbi:hypothetical protein [Enterococcus sp. AZ072]|uniref:hypothetical protein n=1 Tax=unclassified Enterococcus TaxID=2608891 RepID=UPI003D2CFAA8